tara:strand:+ start:41 stop:490 length:450 start_codon:yes stop_codon:yes gene_type:complete
MKKISFLVLVYFLTTAGFFKSALEDCADLRIREFSKFNKEKETKRVKLSETEQKKEDIKFKNDISACKKKFAKGDIKLTVCENRAQIWYSSYKEEFIRNITPEENKKKYKKFISQSLKKKISDLTYENIYSRCIIYKKDRPELFKVKYD